jgi:DNA-binding response OmpR family regulator
VTEQVNAQHTQAEFLPDITSRRILLVEDEPDIAELLIILLETEGAEVIVFHDAEAALSQIESLLPDILLCNVKLPNHDGDWLVKQLRLHSNPSLQHLPAIAITSHTRDVASYQTLNAGFDRFIPKIDRLHEIVQEIVDLLSTHH